MVITMYKCEVTKCCFSISPQVQPNIICCWCVQTRGVVNIVHSWITYIVYRWILTQQSDCVDKNTNSSAQTHASGHFIWIRHILKIESIDHRAALMFWVTSLKGLFCLWTIEAPAGTPVQPVAPLANLHAWRRKAPVSKIWVLRRSGTRPRDSAVL